MEDLLDAKNKLVIEYHFALTDPRCIRGYYEAKIFLNDNLVIHFQEPRDDIGVQFDAMNTMLDFLGVKFDVEVRKVSDLVIYDY